MKPKLLTNSLLVFLTVFTFLPHPAKAQDCLSGILGGTIGGLIGGIIIGSVVSIIITVLVIKSLGYGNNVNVQLNSKRDHSLSLSEDGMSNKDSNVPVKYTRKSEKFSERSNIVDSTSFLIQTQPDKRASGKPAAYLTPGLPSNPPPLAPFSPSLAPLSPPPLSPTLPDTTYVGDDEYDIPCIHPSKNISSSSLAGLHKVTSGSKSLTKSLSVDEMKALRLIKDETVDPEEQYDYFNGPQAGPHSDDDDYYVHVVQDMEDQKGPGKGEPPKLTTPTMPVLPFMRPPIEAGGKVPGVFPPVKLKPVKRPPTTAPKPRPGAPPPTAMKPKKEMSQTLPSKYTRSSSVHEYMNIGFKLAKGKQ